MVHLVYPVGPGRGDLLKYALRSLAVHGAASGLDIAVSVVGHLPDYVDPDAVGHLHIPRLGADPFTHVWECWRALPAYLPEWWWMNDDFFLTGPLADALVHRHRGPLADYVVSLQGRPGTAPWRQRAAALQSALSEHRPEAVDPLCWETHRPMYASARAVIEAADWMRHVDVRATKVALRSLFGVFEGYEGRPVAPAPDPKIDTASAVVLPTPVVSMSPRAWRGRPGEAIRAMFPVPSPWER